MTDNGDGTYSAPLTVNDVGTLSVSAKVFYEGLMGTYSMSGYTIVEYNEGLRHDWGTGAINGFVYSADTIEVLWEGFVLPPADDNYKISLTSLNYGEFEIGGYSFTHNYSDSGPFTAELSLTNEMYPVEASV